MSKVLNEIKEVLEANGLMGIKEPLEKKGFEVKPLGGDMPLPPVYYEVSKDGEQYTIINKKYIEEGSETLLVGDIAIG